MLELVPKRDQMLEDEISRQQSILYDIKSNIYIYLKYEASRL